MNEENLSPHLQKAIKEYVEGEKQKVLHLDCLWCELYGSINADFWNGVLSEQQAKELRQKYLFAEQEEEQELELKL